MNNINTHIVLMCFAWSYSCGAMQPVIPQQGTTKAPITTLAQVSAVVNRAQVLQDTVKTQSGVAQLVQNLSKSSNSDSKDDGKGKAKEKIPSTSSSTPKITGNEEDVQKLLDVVSPLLSQFAKSHNLSLQELLPYAHLLQEFHLEPQVIAHYGNLLHGVNQEPQKHEVAAYSKIQKKDPQKYEELVLNVFKIITDGPSTDNVASLTNSLVSNTHVDVLNNHIESQNESILYRNMGLVAQFLILLGGYAWAIYKQAHGAAGGVPFNGTMG